jgi:hypothetical protein
MGRLPFTVAGTAPASCTGFPFQFLPQRKESLHTALYNFIIYDDDYSTEPSMPYSFILSPAPKPIWQPSGL